MNLFDLSRALLETLGIPYIGSPSTRTSQVVDKAMSKFIMQEYNITCPPGQVLLKHSKVNKSKITYPCVVKPTTTENSVGITLVKSESDLDKAIKKAFQYSADIIIEKFIAGREIRCSVIQETNSQGEKILTALTPQEYEVRQHDLRTTEDKILMDDNGLPLSKYNKGIIFIS